jgi:hypothetical protein
MGVDFMNKVGNRIGAAALSQTITIDPDNNEDEWKKD